MWPIRCAQGTGALDGLSPSHMKVATSPEVQASEWGREAGGRDGDEGPDSLES